MAISNIKRLDLKVALAPTFCTQGELAVSKFMEAIAFEEKGDAPTSCKQHLVSSKHQPEA